MQEFSVLNPDGRVPSQNMTVGAPNTINSFWRFAGSVDLCVLTTLHSNCLTSAQRESPERWQVETPMC